MSLSLHPPLQFALSGKVLSPTTLPAHASFQGSSMSLGTPAPWPLFLLHV